MGFDSEPIGQQPLAVELENGIVLSDYASRYFTWADIEDWKFPGFVTTYLDLEKPEVVVMCHLCITRFPITDPFYIQRYHIHVQEMLLDDRMRALHAHDHN